MTRTLLLPDVNVWIAMTFDSHPHHPAAKLWFDALVVDLLFCRMTQQGFLRLATNPKVAGVHVLTLTEAWQKYDDYLSDPRIGFASEPTGIEAHWRGFSHGGTFSTKVWNDAYLAAFAVAGNYNLITFDKGFARYSGLSLTLLP
ncbi:MAG: PIN domain-containing protein [Gemmataceae bacterium]|nr:PIN domain-containing protein [Gemmataceae bacterium]